MGQVTKVFELLTHTPNRAADDCLLEAIDAGLADCGEPVVKTLLARGHPGGLTGLVVRYHLLSHAQQQIVLRGIEQMFSALRSSIKAKVLQTRLNVLAIIRQSSDYRLAYLLSVALHDASPRVREEAAMAIREVAPRVLSELRQLLAALDLDRPPSYDAALAQAHSLAGFRQEQALLLGALEDALESFDVHHRTEVIEAALGFAHELGPRLWSRLTEPYGKIHRAVVESFQSADNPLLARFTYYALGTSEMRPAIARMLMSRRSPEFMASLIEHAYLLSDPTIRRGMAFVKGVGWLAEGAGPLLALPEELHGKAVAWLRATGLPAESKVELLREMLMAGSPTAQRAALWGLVGLDTEAATQVLETVAGWDQPDLAQIAQHEYRRRRPDDVPTRPRPPTQREAVPVYGSINQDEDHQAFEQMWRSYERGELASDSESARRKVLAVPGLVAGLRDKLASQDSPTRVRGLRMVRQLRLCNECEKEILALSRDADSQTRSAAVIALGHVHGPAAEKVLLAALNDADHRVRANAVEGLEERRSRARVEAFIAKVRDPDNRVRANAIKALLTLQIRQASVGLRQMLVSSDPSYRASSIWVVEQLGLPALVGHVMEMAREDPAPEVRQRAGRATARLFAYATTAARPEEVSA
jgi:HEAT repeat protein